MQEVAEAFGQKESASKRDCSTLGTSTGESGVKASVYFIQAQHGGPIKIGIATDPPARLEQLQCGNPHRLVLRHVQPTHDARTAERTLHQLFAPYRMVGEWFRAVPPLANIARAIPEDGDEVVQYEHTDMRWSQDGLLDTPEQASERYRQRKAAHEQRDADLAAEKADVARAHRWDTSGSSITVIPDDFDFHEFVPGAS